MNVSRIEHLSFFVSKRQKLKNENFSEKKIASLQISLIIFLAFFLIINFFCVTHPFNWAFWFEIAQTRDILVIATVPSNKPSEIAPKVYLLKVIAVS